MGDVAVVYVVKRKHLYWGVGDWTPARALAVRYVTRHHALRAAIGGCRVVRLRVRPRSERLYLAARVAAWEPVVLAALAMERGSLPTYRNEFDQLSRAVRNLPLEHRP